MPEERALGAGTERPRTIAVGIGGAGCNTLKVLPPDAGIERLAVNDLPHASMAGLKRLILTKAGLQGIAAMDEKSVKSLATTTEQSVAVELGGADLVVPLAGLGGEMGSWGANVVARVAALQGSVVLGIVTTPFRVEGPNRQTVANEAKRLLRTHAHGVLELPNDGLLRVAPHLPIVRAFDVMSRLAVQPLLDLHRVLTRDDLPLFRSVMRTAAEWRLGIGEGTSDHPELAATEAAFRSPWVGRDPVDAKAVIVLVGLPAPDPKLAQQVVRDVDLRAPRATVLRGTFTDPATDRIRITLLLGF